MVKKIVLTQQERNSSARFVVYDLWMLRSCADMAKPTQRIELNLWYEGLVLHSRVLRDCFFTKHNTQGRRVTHANDIVAVDFFSKASVWPYTSDDLTPYLRQHKERMDWSLAHLSFSRFDCARLGKDWSAPQLRSEIGDKWLEFISNLQQLGEPATKSFLDHASRLGVPIKAPF